jgi:GTP-binding nuclear protein Ran
LWIARKLAGDQDIVFVEAPALAPPLVEIDEDYMKKLDEEMNRALELPLPECDDDDL